MLKIAAEMCFLEIQREIVFFLFKPKWIQEELVMQCVLTLEDYYSSFKKWFMSPLHYSRVIRMSFEFLVELYVERFIYAAKKSCTTTLLKEYEPKRINMNYYNMKKVEVNQKSSSTDILSQKDRLIKTMSRDMDAIVSTLQNKYGNVVPRSTVEKVTKQFTLIFNLLTIPLCDFDEYLRKVHETFVDNGKYLLESCVAIRDDCDSSFKKKIMNIYIQYSAAPH